MRILIVDDSTYIRSTLKSLCKDQGYEVLGEAKLGENAIDLITEMKPDVITLDNILPDMTGMDILRAIGEDDDLDATVIMISAVGQQSAIEEAKSLGAAYYLVKPYDTEELLGILKELDKKY